MIVYGDPGYESTLGSLIERLRGAVRALGLDPRQAAVRELLIEAGQYEQAVVDDLPRVAPPGVARAEVARAALVTDLAARAFCRRFSHTGAGEPRGLRDELARLERLLDQDAGAPDALLRVKLPEGHAFYALYPEQYAAAARRWLTDRGAGTPGGAVVVGVRSIGTSLSAVVAETLNDEGWAVRRVTVRPQGPPFERRAELDRSAVHGAEWGLVVDEGPGLSGSSMASVAEALVAAGLAAERVVFLPGHGGDPGGAGSDAVRAWWARAPRLVGTREDHLWGGRPLGEALLTWARERLGPDARLEEFGGGRWRRLAYANASAWPAVCAGFERPKYLASAFGGGRLLFSFSGLAGSPDGPGSLAEVAARRQAELARAGWTPAPLGIVEGFVATPWIEGARLARADLSPEVASRVGRYVATAAGLRLSADEQREGVERLGRMLYWNVHEALGEVAAERTRPWTEDALSRVEAALPSYGDGRLAPHEWLRTGHGALLKTDPVGHDRDHTVIGRQSVAWDLAGAIAEWGLGGQRGRAFLRAYRQAGGPDVDPGLVAFHCAAYAAFRLGMATVASLPSGDPTERGRLAREAGRFRRELERRLSDGSIVTTAVLDDSHGPPEAGA